VHPHEADPLLVRAQVERVAASYPFRQCPRLQQFLHLIVEEALAGRSDRIKEYLIGITVYHRGEGYDPRLDSTVRVEAGKLRRMLRDYYAADGRADPLVISIPKGHYCPQFTLARMAGALFGTSLQMNGNGSFEGGVLDPYVRGRYLLYKATSDSAHESAVQYRRCIERDSGAAKAYAELANAQNLLLSIEATPPQEAIPKIVSAARRAIELNDQLGAAYSTLTFAYCLADWNWELAEKTARRGLDLSPQDALGHLCLSGLLAALGRHDASVEEMRVAVHIEPFSIFYNTLLGVVLYYARRFEQAIEQLRKVIELDPTFALAHIWAGLCYAELLLGEDALPHTQKALELSNRHPRMLAVQGYVQAVLGDRCEALRSLSELRALARQVYVSPVGVAGIEAALGETSGAFEALDAAYSEQSYALVWLNVDPRFGRLRSDPYFEEFLGRLKLAKGTNPLLIRTG
jgi:tetratricopeptide (TPR) repeat protein